MTFTIRLEPSGKEFLAEPDKTILDSALSEGVALEHSCKTGECGVCEAKIFSASKNQEKTVLTCQSKPLSDMVLKTHFYPELASIKTITLPCKVDVFECKSSVILIIKFRYPPRISFNFLPGQYIDLTYKGITRSYSIASTPEDKYVELHLKHVENGLMSQAIFQDVCPDILMQINGPKGTFFYRRNECNGPLLFLATGTGFAPIKSIVSQLLTDGEKREINIYWGNRSSELFYDEAPEEWADSFDNVNFFPVLSKKSQSWSGLFGYVQDHAVEAVENFEGVEVYACGALNMIEAAQKAFASKGLSLNRFYSDAFVAS